ncbi:hypothetical protein A374_04794 [Fictibacillus macauensis ZFHKF-1]|uniref:Uncharacterized protein n=1 Tax=Fictibacillus macauensis ZFHKF-1 TaxID=1196324 RepID=I8UJ51_9BACL|nr:hypothetical protein [Fictibacillus macauensis]EIT86863.1 hypothetical protein A374_04794 [Fictibacillus macauensis ZFHKF-1]
MIIAEVKPLPVSRKKEDQDLMYRKLELKMQQLGHLVSFREQLNWEHSLHAVEIEKEALQKLRKTAAKSDGVLLLYAKLLKGTVYQHIILHPNTEGFYLPFRFDSPFYIEVNRKKIWIGSSIRLQEELNWLKLTIQESQDEKAKAAWQTYQELCQQSIATCSPIVFA